MSISLYYQPVNGSRLNTDTPSKTREAISRAFGDGEVVLTTEHLESLQGMKAVDPQNGVWEDLIIAILKFLTVRVWSE